MGNLAATLFADGLEQLRTPDAVGNLFHTAGRTDRRYGPAGQLLEAKGTRYAYDEAGNLKQRILPTGEQWHYAWNAAGHLSEVLRPDGGVVRFTYDALGRRVSKSYKGRITRWVWDGNQPLHEWTELELTGHNTEDVITWLFEPDSFAPLAKLQGANRQSIVCDHLGTPLEMHDGRGQLSWAAELDSYGAVRKQRGEVGACPFRYQGQYEDQETGLYYNRFRYYDPQAGQYVSQDPIRLSGGKHLYGYTTNPLSYIDPLGLSGVDIFRGMSNDSGKPKINPSARGLGARPGPGQNTDIPVDAKGMVHPNTGGLSVAPRPEDLQSHRRPPEFGGTSKDPLWKMNTDDLGPDLKHVPDRPGHGTIQPSRSMHIDEYQKSLGDTQEKWKKACSK